MIEKMTLEKLFELVTSGFKEVRRSTDESIEKLVAMVRDGFADIDKRFQAVDARFANVDQRFDSLERKVDIKIDDLRAEMNDRFDRVDEELHGLHRADDTLSDRITTLEKRGLAT